MELTPQDTYKDLQRLLINAIPKFEFPRQNITYALKQPEIGEDGMINDTSHFWVELTPEEINILAILMKWGWLERQVASVENTRMKYSGPDFKMTSQANHLGKLLTLLQEVRRDSTHMQRLYGRRAGINGRTAWSSFGGKRGGKSITIDSCDHSTDDLEQGNLLFIINGGTDED